MQMQLQTAPVAAAHEFEHDRFSVIVSVMKSICDGYYAIWMHTQRTSLMKT